MNKQERIKELLELMNIPEFEKLINIKVEELKIILARKIKMYYKLKSEFKRAKQEVLFENGVVGRFALAFTVEEQWMLTETPSPAVVKAPEGYSLDLVFVLLEDGEQLCVSFCLLFQVFL